MIQRVGVNTRVQRQNTSNSKPQNFGERLPQKAVLQTVADHSATGLSNIARKIGFGFYHTAGDFEENRKFIEECTAKAKTRNEILAWRMLSTTFRNKSAQLKMAQ